MLRIISSKRYRDDVTWGAAWAGDVTWGVAWAGDVTRVLEKRKVVVPFVLEIVAEDLVQVGAVRLDCNLDVGRVIWDRDVTMMQF